MTLSHGPVDIGEQAPAFTLRHTFEHSVSLRETLNHGPVVLAFYVFDFGGL